MKNVKNIVLAVLAVWLGIHLLFLPLFCWSYSYPNENVGGWIRLAARLAALVLAAGVACALGRQMHRRQHLQLRRFPVLCCLGASIVLWVVYFFVHWEIQGPIVNMMERMVPYEVFNFAELPLPFVYIYETVFSPAGILTLIVSIFAYLLTLTFLPKKAAVSVAASA